MTSTIKEFTMNNNGIDLSQTPTGMSNKQTPSKNSKNVFRRLSSLKPKKSNSHRQSNASLNPVECSLRESMPDTSILVSDSGHTSIQSQNRPTEAKTRPQNHPDLENLFIINDLTTQRLHPNTEPIPVDNEYMKGVFLPMFRTSDVDEPSTIRIQNQDSISALENEKYSTYFKTKKRRFEMQVQVKFKKVPESQLWIGFNIDQPIKLGSIQRAFVKGSLKFISKRTALYYHLPEDNDNSEKKYMSSKEKSNQTNANTNISTNPEIKDEKPKLVFPIYVAMDRFVVTPADQEPPKLGEEIYEDEESVRRRNKTKEPFKPNTTDTYTMSIWSAYVDFLQWKVMNLPAIPSFSLSSVVGNQPFSLTLYTCDAKDGRHYESEMKIFGKWEFSHKTKSSLGPATQRWLQHVERENNNDEKDNNRIFEEDCKKYLASPLLNTSIFRDTNNHSPIQLQRQCTSESFFDLALNKMNSLLLKECRLDSMENI